MASQSDRVVIKFGPGRLDADKAIQREIDNLRDEVETKTTLPAGDYPTSSEVEDIVNDIINNYPPVAGGGGFVIGIPPGTPLAYAPLNLVNFPIDFSATSPNMHFALRRSNWPAVPITYVTRDKYNVLGHGVDTLLFYVSPLGELQAFSSASGLVETVDFPTTVQPIRGFFSINGNIVADVASGVETNGAGLDITVYVYNGSNVSSFVAPATSNFFLSAMGPSASGNNIVMVWISSTLQAILIREYAPDGTLVGSYTHTLLTGLQNGNINNNASYGVIENGWMAIMSVGKLYVRKASAEAPNLSVFGTTLKALAASNVFVNNTDAVSILPSGKVVTQNVTDIVTFQTDLIICDYASGSTTSYPGAIYNAFDLGERPYLMPLVGSNTYSRNPTASSITAIDDTKFIVTGGTKVFDGTSYYHVPVSLYITLVDDPENPGTTIFTNAYISHEDFLDISGTSAAVVNYSPVAHNTEVLSDGSVVYSIGSKFIANLPYCIMFNVKAEDYAP